MAKVDYQKFLESLSIAELQDHIEAVWRGEYELTLENEAILQNYLVLLKPEEYAVVWVVLAALVAATPGAATPGAEPLDPTNPIAKLVKNLPEPEVPPEIDFVWITKLDARVCNICGPLHGKVIGENLVLLGIKTHPGCRCEIVAIPKGVRAMKIRTLEAGAVRAVVDGKKRILEVLAAPFGSPSNLDRYDQYFTARTDFMIEVGDRRPTLYLHGYSPRKRLMENTPTLGVATVSRIDEKGVWMQTEIDNSELANRTWESALLGNAKASTGSIPHLIRPALRGGKWPPGPVECWPIAELSVYDGETGVLPVSDDAVVLPLRALFDEHSITLPDYLEAGKDKRDDRRDKPTIRTTEIEMDKKEEQSMAREYYASFRAEEKALEVVEAEKETALRAKIEKELKENPNYRATFNINKIDDKEASKDAVELENFSYVRSLVEDARTVIGGGIPAMRVTTPLDETSADELQSMVPEDMHNKIHELLGKYSLVDKLAAKGLMTIYTTDKLIFNVPKEVTAMTTMSDIAEVGAYTENSPEFVNVPITMQKVGNFVSVTEEALEDQGLFQQWLIKACARAIALSKNLDLHVLMDAIAGVQIASTDVLLDSEVTTLYYGLAQEYREGSCFIMNDLTLGYIRAMLIATPRAYGEFGFNPMSMGELGEYFLNKPVFTNGNWAALVTGLDNEIGITFADFNEAIFWVERRQMSIFVDPYSTKLSAGTVNFLPSARYAGATVNTAAVSGVELKTT